MELKLKVLPEKFAVCRLAPQAAVPDWAGGGSLSSITRTADELSIVCLESQVPDGVLAEKGWRCIKIQGPLPLSTTGILASLVNPLARAGIGVFAFSTYDTDYALVKDEAIALALKALVRAGHNVERA